MTVHDLMNALDKFASFSMAEDWDNVGLLVGRKKERVQRILVCLDITRDVCSHAAETGTGLLVCHHPVLLDPIRNLTHPILLTLVEHRINVICMHTNYDYARMNWLLAERFGLVNPEHVMPCDLPGRYLAVQGEWTGGGCGKRFLQTVKETLQVEKVKLTGTLPTIVRRVAVAAGSGRGAAARMEEICADILVTGELRHHEALEGYNRGCCFVEAGHERTESLFIGDVVRYLSETCGSIHVEGYSQEISRTA